MTQAQSAVLPAAILVLASLAFGAPQAAAAAKEAPSAASDASALKTMIDCRKLPTKDARADCYDAAVDALAKAQTEGKVVVIDQDKLTTVRRQAFGFNLPSLSLLSRGLKETPIEAMTFQVSHAYEDSNERWVIETTEGAVWRQTQSTGFALTPHTGSAMIVRPGIMGSFFCQVDGQAQFRCKRDH